MAVSERAQALLAENEAILTAIERLLVEEPPAPGADGEVWDLLEMSREVDGKYEALRRAEFEEWQRRQEKGVNSGAG